MPYLQPFNTGFSFKVEDIDANFGKLIQLENVIFPTERYGTAWQSWGPGQSVGVKAGQSVAINVTLALKPSDATYSTLKFTSKKMDGYWHEPIFETKWFPEAFIGTMGDLFQAIETDGEPSIGGADNLKTLQLVFACYKSAKERRSVKPSEIAAEVQPGPRR